MTAFDYIVNWCIATSQSAAMAALPCFRLSMLSLAPRGAWCACLCRNEMALECHHICAQALMPSTVCHGHLIHSGSTLCIHTNDQGSEFLWRPMVMLVFMVSGPVVRLQYLMVALQTLVPSLQLQLGPSRGSSFFRAGQEAQVSGCLPGEP